MLDGWPVCAARKDKVLVFNKIYERLPSQEYLGILLNFTATNIQTNRMLALLHKFWGRIDHPLVQSYAGVDLEQPFGFILKDMNKPGLDVEVRLFFKRNVWKKNTMKDRSGYQYFQRQN